MLQKDKLYHKTLLFFSPVVISDKQGSLTLNSYRIKSREKLIKK